LDNHYVIKICKEKKKKIINKKNILFSLDCAVKTFRGEGFRGMYSGKENFSLFINLQ